jgi:hypothetical protein
MGARRGRHSRLLANSSSYVQNSLLWMRHLTNTGCAIDAPNGGDARFAESDADHTARVERETQLA